MLQLQQRCGLRGEEGEFIRTADVLSSWFCSGVVPTVYNNALLCLQFVCTLLFAFFGGAAPGGSAAAANGVALAVLGECSASRAGKFKVCC